MVGVVRCMGRSCGIAGELSSFFTFVCSVQALLLWVAPKFYVLFRYHMSDNLQDLLVQWPGVPTIKFPPLGTGCCGR